MLNASMESHVIRVKVYIKKLFLKVRFPCSVSFQLKNEINFIETKSSFTLKDNEATINQGIELQVETEFNNNRQLYQDKKITIVIYMSSSNGKVIAGSVKFNIFEKNLNMKSQFSLNLQKCPDKNAKLLFTSTTQYVKTNQSNYQHLEKSQYSYINDLKHLSPRNFNANTITHRDTIDSQIKSTTTAMKKSYGNHGGTKGASHHQATYATKNKSRGNLGVGEDFGTASYRSNRIKQEYTPKPNNYKLSYVESQKLLKSEKYGNDYKRQMHINFSPQRYSSKGKRDKKNMEKVKTQITTRHRQEMCMLQNRIQQYKQQIDNLTHQLQISKQKVKTSQRRQGNIQISIKQLKDELQKKKNKVIDQAQKISFMELQIQAREKDCKNLVNDKKKLQQRLEKEQLQSKTEEKKAQYKTNSLKDQLAKLEQKYKQSEMQRELSVAQQNNMLNKLEESEKKNQQILRQKQRAFSEQRIKLNKKIQFLNVTLKGLQDKIQHSETTISQLNTDKKIIYKKESQKDIALQKLQSEFDHLMTNYKKESQQRKSLEEQIGNHYKKVQEQKNKLKKSSIQQSHQLTSLKDKIMKLYSLKITLDQKIITQQEKIKQLINENKTINANNNNSKSQIQQLKGQISRLMRQKQLLDNDVLTSNRKLYELKSQSDNMKNNYQNIINQYEDKVLFYTKNKGELQKQLDQAKWNIDKNKQYIEDLTYQYKTVNGEILDLNELLYEKVERIKKSQEQLMELKTENELKTTQLNNCNSKIKQLISSGKAKEQEIYSAKKKNQELEQELFLCRDKIKHMENSFKQKTETNLKKQKQRQNIVQLKSGELSEAEIKIIALKEQAQTLKQSNSLLVKQTQHLKINEQNLKMENENLQTSLYKLKQKINSLENQLNNSQYTIKGKQESIKRLQKNIKKVQLQHQNYQQVVILSLQNLLTELSKQQEKNVGLITSTTLKGIIDPKISKLQIQLIQTRNNNVLKHKTRIFELEETINMKNIQNQKLTKFIENLEKQSSCTITDQKNRIKVLQNEHKNDKQSLLSEIKTLQQSNFQKFSDIQKLNIQMNRRKQIIEEQNVQVHILISQYQSQKEQNRTLQNKINAMRLEQIKVKASLESKFNEMLQHYQQIIDKLRKSCLELERQNMDNQSQIITKEQQLKNKQSQLNKLNFEIERQREKTTDEKQKYVKLNVQKQRIDRKCRQQEKEIKKLTSLINQLEDTEQNEKVKYEQLTINYKRLEMEFMTAQVNTQKTKMQVQLNRQKFTQMESIIKSSGQSHKIQLEKYLQTVRKQQEEIIKLKSQIQLKNFQIKQLTESQYQQREQLKLYAEDLSKKKIQLQDLESQKQQAQRIIMDLNSKISLLVGKKSQLENQLTMKIGHIENYKFKLSKIPILEEIIEKKDKQSMRYRQEKINIDRQKDKIIQNLKNQIRELKNQNSTVVMKEQDNKRKIRELQYLLENDNCDFYEQRQKWSSINDRQKQQIYKRIEMIEKSKNNLEQEFQFQRQQLQRQLQSITQQYNKLVDRIKIVNIERIEIEEKKNYIQNKYHELINKYHKASKLSQQQKQKNILLEGQIKKVNTKYQQVKKSNQNLMKKYKESYENFERELETEKNRMLSITMKDEQMISSKRVFNKIQNILKNSPLAKLDKNN